MLEAHKVLVFPSSLSSEALWKAESWGDGFITSSIRRHPVAHAIEQLERPCKRLYDENEGRGWQRFWESTCNIKPVDT